MDLSHPESRIEKFLAKLLKLSPDPYPYGVRSRIEAYLRYMIENGVPATKTGYYYNGEFYNDSAHTDKIDPIENMLYTDKLTHKLYLWDTSTESYVLISGGGGGGSTAEDISYDGTLEYSNGTVGKALNSLESNKIDKPDEEIPEGYVYKSDGEGSGSWEAESGGGGNPYHEGSEPPEDTDIFWIDTEDHSVPQGTSAEYITFNSQATYSNGTIGKKVKDLDTEKISNPASTVPEGYVYKSDGEGSGSWQEESGGSSNVFVAKYGVTTFEEARQAYLKKQIIVAHYIDQFFGPNGCSLLLSEYKNTEDDRLFRFEGVLQITMPIVGEIIGFGVVTLSENNGWSIEADRLPADAVSYNSETEYPDDSIGKAVHDLFLGNIFVAKYNETSFNDIDEAIYNNTPVVLVHPDYGMTLACIGDNIPPNVLNTPRLMAAIPMHRFEGIIEDGGLHKIAYATVTSEDVWNFEIFCLDSEFINYDEEVEYSDGSIGKAINQYSSQIADLGNATETAYAVASDRYEGVDLTVKFADEIANFSDEWAWIKNRISARNYNGLNVHDYIPTTCLNGYLIKPEIAGFDPYIGSGSPEIGKHIDFITKDCWPDTFQYNPANNNNGFQFIFTGDGSTTDFICDKNASNFTEATFTGHPYEINRVLNRTTEVTSGWSYDNTTGTLHFNTAPESGATISAQSAIALFASNAYAYLNSLKTVVPNSTVYNGDLKDVDYTNGGIYSKLPQKLKNVISGKNYAWPTRCKASALQSNADNYKWATSLPLWLPDEMEVYGCPLFATGTYEKWFGRQYECFRNGNRKKGSGNGGGRAYWWLSVAGASTTYVCYVGNNGTAYNSPASTGYRGPVCFRITG